MRSFSSAAPGASFGGRLLFSADRAKPAFVNRLPIVGGRSPRGAIGQEPSLRCLTSRYSTRAAVGASYGRPKAVKVVSAYTTPVLSPPTPRPEAIGLRLRKARRR